MADINNLVLQDGGSFEVQYNIDLSATTKATRDNFCALMFGNNKAEKVFCWYTGTDALTLAEFKTLPIGSLIFAPMLTAGGEVYCKAAAPGTSTWSKWALTAIS